jgi:hypothetical protein
MKSKKSPNALSRALVASHNRLCQSLATKLAYPHADVTSSTTGYWHSPVVTPILVSAPNATNLATSITLLADIDEVLGVHYADLFAHKIAWEYDFGSVATNLATAISKANALKADVLLHAVDLDTHYAEDQSTAIDAVDATDEPSLVLLVNAIKGGVNTHINNALTSYMIEQI